MERIDAFRDDSAWYPLGKIAESPIFVRWGIFKKYLLHLHVELKCKIYDLLYLIRAFEKTQIGFCGTHQFKNEIEGIDKDEVADPEFILRYL